MPRGIMALSKTFGDAIKYFGSARNYSPATIENFQRSVDHFIFFLKSRGLPDDIRQFNDHNAFQYSLYLAEKNYKASSIVTHLKSISSLAKALMKLRDARGRPYLTHDPMRTFDWPTVDYAETGWLLPAEAAMFLAVPRPLRESVARDLLMDTGMRVSEACKLNVGDVLTIDNKTIVATTVKGRGRKVRKHHIPVSANMASFIFDYLVERGISNPADPEHSEKPLLLMSDGRRWNRAALSHLMVRIGEEAGITRMRVSAHKLRHTASLVSRFARKKDGSLLDRWVRSRMLSQQNPQSLDRYEHLFPEQLFEAREAYRRALEQYVRGTLNQAPEPLSPDAER